jgi:hypothetical protein
MERGRRWLGVPVLLLALTAAMMIAAPAERAGAAECPADYCTERTTDANGNYFLTIPAGGISLIPGGAALADCKWQVEVQFSDGSEPEELVFDATKEFKSSHQFPEPGLYLVDIYATKGVHSGGSSECPDLHIQAKVTYPEPPPPKETEEPPQGGPGAQAPGGGAAAAAGTAAAPSPPPAPYWQACGGGMRAHLLTCRKARAVLAAARDLLSRAGLAHGGTFKAAGFSCSRRGGSSGAISCRRGRQRVLGA